MTDTTDDQTGQADTRGEGDEQANSDLNRLIAALFPALEPLPRVPQQARSREKRDELLKAAYDLFVRQGYAATTADDIAETAGVAVGTFYNYFRNKRQILLVLVIDRLDSIFGSLRLAQTDFSSSGDQREVIRQSIASVLASDGLGFRRVWAELLSFEPELWPYQQVARRYIVTQVEARLRESAAEGLTWPELDIEATAAAVFAMLDALSLRPPEELAADRLIAGVTDVIFRAIFRR